MTGELTGLYARRAHLANALWQLELAHGDELARIDRGQLDGDAPFVQRIVRGRASEIRRLQGVLDDMDAEIEAFETKDAA